MSVQAMKSKELHPQTVVVVDSSSDLYGSGGNYMRANPNKYLKQNQPFYQNFASFHVSPPSLINLKCVVLEHEFPRVLDAGPTLPVY